MRRPEQYAAGLRKDCTNELPSPHRAWTRCIRRTSVPSMPYRRAHTWPPWGITAHPRRRCVSMLAGDTQEGV